MGNNTDHDATVRKISAAVAKYYVQGAKYRIFHGSSNSTRPPHSGNYVDISSLNRILEINTENMTATVEPNVSMDTLVQATISRGLIPPIVMEFPGITVGGSFAGSSGESTSWKFDSLNELVCEIEVVLGNGDVITASPTENADLFEGIGGSLGTLGIITKGTLQLVHAPKYVRLAYHQHTTIESAVAAIKEATSDRSNDYIDGIVFSRDHSVVMLGKGTNEVAPGCSVRTFSKAWDNWFYLHVQDQPRTEVAVDYIPLAEYLFRYDRGSFWMAKYALEYWGFIPSNRLTRAIFDDMLHTRPLYRAMQRTNSSSLTLVQDISFPYDTVCSFMHYVADQFEIWPLWLCPLPAVPGPTFHPHSVDENGKPVPMLNVGVWGQGPADVYKSVESNRDLEMKAVELRGRKVLYAHAYYTEEEFWKIYGKEWYDKLRTKYKATMIPSAYEKVKVDVAEFKQESPMTRMRMQWPLTGVLGVFYAMASSDIRAHHRLPISSCVVPDSDKSK
ncbi:hypothetical protein TD95_000439 [Thielaviopsis punctulata]|uniref:Delta(24)-sterol reductase n=1 Tax=Thielaviopsis punctulata TaxID=72032 RepID=A0A0F4ZHZ6_9PEZI|nr:hypothetical protein TD95_000439 [Thielaviopsis punctulata]